jgi:hypothetical protein
VDFRVLGPVQVAAGWGPVELASGRQLALLTCLLIARDEVSSRDRLIDALWGEQPPATAPNALQVQVLPVGCTGAHALKAAREVHHARRKFALRFHRGRH